MREVDNTKFIQRHIGDDFKVDVEKLRQEQISVLKAIKRVGEKHLKYFHETMSAFQHPEKRLKAFDTQYYEKVIPEINKILEDYHALIQKR